VSEDRIAHIAAMITATAGHGLPDFADAGAGAGAARDCALFLDFDLAILGSPPATFAAYEQAVRREYDWAPEAARIRLDCWKSVGLKPATT